MKLTSLELELLKIKITHKDIQSDIARLNSYLAFGECAFSPIELILNTSGRSYALLARYIMDCKLLQTPEVMNLYFEWDRYNDLEELEYLIEYCKYCQTPEIIGIYKSWGGKDCFDDLLN